MKAGETLLTVQQLADRLAVKPSWVYAQAESNSSLPHYKIGRYLRFSAADIDDWLNRQRHEKRPRA